MYSDEDNDDDDSSTNICDVSLGREIMQACKMQDRRTSQGARRKSVDQQQQHKVRHEPSVLELRRSLMFRLE